MLADAHVLSLGYLWCKCDEMHLRWVFTVETAAIPLSVCSTWPSVDFLQSPFSLKIRLVTRPSFQEEAGIVESPYAL